MSLDQLILPLLIFLRVAVRASRGSEAALVCHIKLLPMIFRQCRPYIAHSAIAWISLKILDSLGLYLCCHFHVRLLFAKADIFGDNFCHRCDSERNYHDGEGLAWRVVPKEVAVIFALQTVKQGYFFLNDQELKISAKLLKTRFQLILPVQSQKIQISNWS